MKPQSDQTHPLFFQADTTGLPIAASTLNLDVSAEVPSGAPTAQVSGIGGMQGVGGADVRAEDITDDGVPDRSDSDAYITVDGVDPASESTGLCVFMTGSAIVCNYDFRGSGGRMIYVHVRHAYMRDVVLVKYTWHNHSLLT